MTPVVSIIICTRNRAASLGRTLETIQQCNIPGDMPAELLIVDNGSTDDTRQTIERLRLSTMPVRYFLEPTGGQSRARNRGLAESLGGIILFTDDDVRVGRDWIEGMCRPIFDRKADAVAGGVRFPRELDDKIRACRSWFACTEEIISDKPDRFVGASMAFSRAVLARVPAFDSELGPGALGFGDETLFSYQLREAGFRLITRFDVSVEHHFDPQRLNRARMIEMAREMGRSKAYVAYHWGHAELNGRDGSSMRDWVRVWADRLARREASDIELHLIEHAAMRRHYEQESNRPRNYARHGLVKVGGV